MLPKHAGWGGRRKGAGRKAKGERPGVSHRGRPVLPSRFPVHVTLRVLAHVWNLRSRRGFRVVERALALGGDRLGFRVCEFSVQGNHFHLITEALDAPSLSRAMQGLSVRLARGLNRMMGRMGKVLADRFHARILRTPTEVRRAVTYVRNNRAVHRARWSGPRGATDLVGARRTERAGFTVPDKGIRADIPSPNHARRIHGDRYSSATPDHRVALPQARTYLLRRAQRELC
jgi:putative transposase